MRNSGKKLEATLSDDWHVLFQAAGLFRLVSEKATGSCNHAGKLDRLTLNQARIFGHIFANPDVDIRLSRLAHDLDVTPAAASQAVDRLVAEGLLDRRPDPTDRRAVVIAFSAKGRAVLDEIREESGALLADIYRETGATQEEIATFRGVLSRLHQALVRRWLAYIAQKDAKENG